jgi:hypothetical protein
MKIIYKKNMTKMGEYFVSNMYIYIYLQSIKIKHKIKDGTYDGKKQCKENNGVDIEIYNK